MTTSSASSKAPAAAHNPVQIFLDRAMFTLEVGGLTPLQTHELRTATKAHEDSNMVDSVALQKQRADIDKHWAAVTSTLEKHGHTTCMLYLFGRDFAALIADEYYEAHFGGQRLLPKLFINEFVQMFGTGPERAKALESLVQGDESKWPGKYERTLGYAVEELMLDREHAENRFRAAAQRESLTKPLLQAKDETQLLRLIKKDLDAVGHIVSYLPYMREVEEIISAQAQTFMVQVRPGAAASKKPPPLSGSTWWGSLRRSFAGPPRHITPESLSEIRALLSDTDFQKKTT